jgi:ADP-ribosylglycohydrolase
MIKLEDRFHGFITGAAIGDALGAPGEFITLNTIREKYGVDGITDLYDWHKFPDGSYTDDTQMTIATMDGCINAHRKHQSIGIDDIISDIHASYYQWLATQKNPLQRRAPGYTCITALESGRKGTIEMPINNSKGCGGIMRVSPIGLIFKPHKAFEAATKAAALTHGHPSGYLSAGFLSCLISLITHNLTLEKSIEESVLILKSYPKHNETLDAVQASIDLAGRSRLSTNNGISCLGEGWVGEEALAISLYCALCSKNDWKKAVLSAVNHSGDTDSTGSICGSIMGTILGIDSIPDKWKIKLKNSKNIYDKTNDLFNLFINGSNLI